MNRKLGQEIATRKHRKNFLEGIKDYIRNEIKLKIGDTIFQLKLY